MKLQRFFPTLIFFAFALVVFSACNEDDIIEEPTSNLEELALDGPNANAPALPAGTYEFAVQLYESDLRPFAGRNLTALRVYLRSAPATMRLKVYKGGDLSPGTLLTTLNVGGNGGAGRFRDYLLPAPIEIDDSDVLWLAAEVELNSTTQTVGCDAGPRIEGGDWIFSDGSWTSFFEFASGESINWNIRGLVE